jgi:hypothetical protein
MRDIDEERKEIGQKKSRNECRSRKNNVIGRTIGKKRRGREKTTKRRWSEER